MDRKRSLSSWLTLILIVVPLVGGCKKDEEQPASPLRWTEDVRLPDGRIITLTRYQEFKGPHELGQPPGASNYWLEFHHPDTGNSIRWEQSSPPYLIPIALITKGKSSFMLTMPGVGMAWEAYKCPNPIYLLFKQDNGQGWSKVDLSELPDKNVIINLTYTPEEKRNEIEKSHQHLSVNQTINQTNGGRRFELNFSDIKQEFNGPPCKWRDTSKDAR